MDDDAERLEQLTQRRDLLYRSCLCTDGRCPACNAVANRIAELEEEEVSMTDVIIRQGDLLRGVVNALKGPPPPDTSWSHHDAPELAQNLVNELAAIRSEIADLRDEIARAAGADSRTDELERLMHAAENILRERR